MLQAIVKKGKVVGEEIPAPVVSEGTVLIKVVNSCISAGTETGKIVRSGKSLLKAAIEQPENVKQVVDMVKSKGLSKTMAKVKGIVGSGKPTGYSVAGIVIAKGDGVSKFKVGDSVAASGADLANHAEYVNVPENLVMKIPSDINFKQASTVTLGGIAMQGMRRAD
jgi:NADPH:quinone reductase-like Zn-dependent oxidoreductase